MIAAWFQCFVYIVYGIYKLAYAIRMLFVYLCTKCNRQISISTYVRRAYANRARGTEAQIERKKMQMKTIRWQGQMMESKIFFAFMLDNTTI